MKRETLNVILVLLLALGLRVLFLILAGINAPLAGDELAYQQIAENFAAGHGLFQTNNPFFPGEALYAWQAPLYPLTLGILYATFGINLLLAKLFVVLLSTATVYLTYDLTFHVSAVTFDVSSLTPFGTSSFTSLENRERVTPQKHRIALVAALLVAIYPGFLTHAHLLLSETLFIFLLLLAFDCVVHAFEPNAPVRVWLAGAGALWGLAILTRGIILYFTPLMALWIGWMLWRHTADEYERRGEPLWSPTPSSSPKPSWSPKRGIVGAGLFLFCVALLIAPWTARNYVQFGQFVPVETKGGVNLWLGNSPHTPDDFIRNVWKVGVREPMLAELPPDEIQRDRAAYALALGYIRAEPLRFVARMPLKFADFWGFERNLIDNAEATRRGEGWNSAAKLGADLLAAVVYMFVVLTGAAGFLLGPRDPYKWLFGGFTLYYLAAHLIIFGDGRFHLPLIPFFAIYAAWLLVRFKHIQFSIPRAAITILCCALLLIVWLREAVAAFQVLRGG